MNAEPPLKLARRLRLSGGLLLGFGAILIGIFAWVPRQGERPSVHAAAMARGGTPQVMMAAESPAATVPEVMELLAASAAPNKQGGYESLGAAVSAARHAVSAARHAVSAVDPAGLHTRGARYFAANPGQQLRAWFANDGVELASGIATPAGEEPWSLKVRLMQVGREGAMNAISPGSIAGKGSRVEMIHPKATVTQWFENRKEGLEQGFTLTQAPAGGAGEAMILLGTEGTLRPMAMAGATGIRFVDEAGADVLHYTGLQAWDADGRALSARMEVRGELGESGDSRSGSLALIVADAGARYPITVDPLFANVEARLVERSVAQDYFGTSVALSGDTAVIGAPYEDTLGRSDAGAAYVFVRVSNKWRLQAKLSADDLADEDFFGDSVAIAGDTVVVGADWADPGGKANAGKAYVFVRNGTAWSQQAMLTAGDAAADDHFGAAVAVSGDTAVVGAPADDTSSGMDAGSASIFVRTAGVWTQQAQLRAFDAAEGDAFGSSVAVDGGTAVVGAPCDDTAAGVDAGSAYVFVRSGTAWNHESHLLAPNAAAADGLGCAVAVAGNTAVVGAKGDDTVAGADAGSALVFVRSGVEWQHQATLLANAAAAGDAFGSVVALDGNTAVVGAPEHASNGKAGSGSVAVFSRSGVTWSEQATLAGNDPAEGDSFGAAVAVSGNTVVAGALGDDTEAGLDAGSATVFVNGGTGWATQAGLLADNSRVEDFFGVAVALSGDTALIGAYADDTPAGVDVGSAYLFVRREMLWVQEAKLSASAGAAGDAFGAAVALAGDTALIGASAADPAGRLNAGNVSVFVRSGSGWVEQQVLVAGDGAADDRFGGSLAIAGDTALIGAAGDDTAAGENAGSAYVFRLAGGSWVQEAQLKADDAATGDGFGGAVALAGDTALVGASRANTPAGLDAGKAYVFTRSGATWTQQTRLTAPNAAADDRFGSAVALSNSTALVGAPYDNGPGGLGSGSAHVFVRDGTNWSAQAKLTASDAGQGDGFGFAVALDGDTALVGSPLDNLPAGYGAGSAYVYARSGTVWGEQMKLTAGVDASAGDAFGTAVALSGNTALVGAYADATAGPAAGSAYIYLLGELPVITRQPESKMVVPGQSATFTVLATGYGPLRYQWRKNGFPLEGAATSSYAIASAQLTDQGDYDCVVSNIGGVTTSAPATLRVNALSQFTQTFPGAPPDAQGFVLVTLTPVGTGAWRFVGEQQWRASGVPVGGLATGDRTIEFRPVPGSIQPPRESVGVVSGGAATLLDRTYYETPTIGSGGLTVMLKPDALVAESVPVATRAQWRLLGEDDTQWRNSGTSLAQMTPGNYLIECKPVAGRATPPAAAVVIQNGTSAAPTLTYFLADAVTGTQPVLVPFETVTTDPTKPYAYVGQIRSDVGSSSGFVVKSRVVATAGHVVFDDGTLSAVTGLQWLFQRQPGTYEPKPQIPRGFYSFDGYAAQRILENTPGTSSPESQNLDAAALYFVEDAGAGRGGSSGYLASDLDTNEFLLSPAQKMLVGYPVDGIATVNQGRMHATPPANAIFSHAFGHTYTTPTIRSSGGASGGPLCVQFEGGNYYPAAIYLGGSGQTVVRSIDSQVIDLFNRAGVSASGGANNTGGGITHTGVTSTGDPADPGVLVVNIEPAAARDAGAGWRLKPETTYRRSGAQKSGLNPVSYVVELSTVSGFLAPKQETVVINGGQVKDITYEYVENPPPPVITSANAAVGTRWQGLTYQIVASNSPDSYSLTGSLPSGLTFDASAGKISGTPQEAGLFIVTVAATNVSGTGTKGLAITCRPSLANQSTSVQLGQPLNFQIASSESSSGVSYSASGLPQGVDIASATGLMTGSPLQAGVFPALLTVSKEGASASAILTLTVTATPLDIWRLAKFGTTNNTGTAADTEDPDHDGQTNLSEYAAGTNPNDASDVFKVLTAARTGSTFTLTAAGKAGRTYGLQRKNDLSSGTWTTVTTRGPLAIDDPVTLTDFAAPEGNAFYRIQATAP